MSDPVSDPDPGTEFAIIEAVRSLASVTGPDEQARERMRERISARLNELGPAPADHRRRDRSTGHPLGSGIRGRLGVALAASVAVVFLLTGMSALFAQAALPGEALYGVKRTAEAAALGLTFSDESRARKHLDHAAARVSELETLAQRYPEPADAPTGPYQTALRDLDNDATAGSRQLIPLATRADIGQLESLRDWAQQQRARLATVAPHLPIAVHDRWNLSATLLNKIIERAAVLLGRTNCYQLTTGYSDEVGPLPATGTCGDPAAAAGAPAAPGRLPNQRPAKESTPPSADSSHNRSTPDTGQQPEQTPSLAPTTTPPSEAVPPPTVVRPPLEDTQPAPPLLLPWLPLPLPLIELSSLLPGFPGLSVG